MFRWKTTRTKSRRISTTWNSIFVIFSQILMSNSHSVSLHGAVKAHGESRGLYEGFRSLAAAHWVKWAWKQLSSILGWKTDDYNGALEAGCGRLLNFAWAEKKREIEQLSHTIRHVPAVFQEQEVQSHILKYFLMFIFFAFQELKCRTVAKPCCMNPAPERPLLLGVIIDFVNELMLWIMYEISCKISTFLRLQMLCVKIWGFGDKKSWLCHLARRYLRNDIFIFRYIINIQIEIW